jgi:hypothetical protein
MSKRKLAGRAERKVAKDGRYTTKKRRPTGTVTEPLYLYVVKGAAAHAKTEGVKRGSVSVYVEKLILRDKSKNSTKQAAA